MTPHQQGLVAAIRFVLLAVFAVCLILFGALALGGCGSAEQGYGGAPEGYTVVELPWEGGIVKCYRWEAGHQGGLSCDFDAFHAENG